MMSADWSTPSRLTSESCSCRGKNSCLTRIDKCACNSSRSTKRSTSSLRSVAGEREGVVLLESDALVADERISIRPGVSILAVLRHLNYRPWYAMAEFVD